MTSEDEEFTKPSSLVVQDDELLREDIHLNATPDFECFSPTGLLDATSPTSPSDSKGNTAMFEEL